MGLGGQGQDLGPAQPRGAPAGDLRALPGSSWHAWSPRPHRSRPGGPALGRPDLAAAHRGAPRSWPARPAARARHQTPRARPGGSSSRKLPRGRHPVPAAQVELRPSPKRPSRALARSLVGGDAAETVIDAMCAGVEGNPLFLEERLSSLVETGALVRDETAWRLSGTPARRSPRCWNASSAPGSTGSVLGRGKSPSPPRCSGGSSAWASLRRLLEVEGELATGVGELCAAGLLTEVRQVPEPAYRFRHALIQDAIYWGCYETSAASCMPGPPGAWRPSRRTGSRGAAAPGRHYAAAGEAQHAPSTT